MATSGGSVTAGGGVDKYIASSFSTVLIISIDGKEYTKEQSKIEAQVEKKVKDVVNKLKASHGKFEDPDFGPNEKDEYGAISFYGDAPPAPAGSKYPKPETLRWERPQYRDDKFVAGGGGGGDGPDEAAEVVEEGEEEEEDDEFGFGGDDEEDEMDIWCKHGSLFIDGSSSGDVIQGQLGDCWFLSALAVLGAHDDGKKLEQCFWRRDAFKEFGMYVVRFFKDCNVIFVLIDDRLPVKSKDGKLIFAGNKDPNELWVPLIEKAFAKLHGCYKALIGGYSHYGLADMTGYCPRLVVLKEGYLGFSEKYQPDEVWQMLHRYQSWGSLLGCSIQPNPKVKSKPEAEAGQGLYYGHAYSLLAIGAIDGSKVTGKSSDKCIRLLKLRNPWGRGEWEGAFSDNSDEYATFTSQIDEVFNRDTKDAEKLTQDPNDGTFLIRFEDWLQLFTSVFVAVNFPQSWTGKRSQGSWQTDKGGNRDMGTWISNPKFKLVLGADKEGGQRQKQHAGADKTKQEYRQVFIGLYTKDSRLVMGGDYYKDPLYATPLAFDIVTKDQVGMSDPKQRGPTIKEGCRYILDERGREKASFDVKQAPYNFGTTQVEVCLKVGVEYYIVPSLYKRNQAGTFFLNVYADVDSFHLDGGTTVVDASAQPMVIGNPSGSNQVTLKMSQAQYFDKKESLRERICAEAKRLGMSPDQLAAIFNDLPQDGDGAKMSRADFKRRMVDMGFMLTDFPDDDLVVLDADNDGTITPAEFVQFVREGQKFADTSNVAGPPPAAPVDDLLLKPPSLAGELTVTFTNGRNLRPATTWFNSKTVSEGKAAALSKPAAEESGAAAAAAAAAVAATEEAVNPLSRKYVNYDPKAAAALRKEVLQQRMEAEKAAREEANKPLTPDASEPAVALDANASAAAAAADPLELEAVTPINSADGRALHGSLSSANLREHDSRYGGTRELSKAALRHSTATLPRHDHGEARTVVTAMTITHKEMVMKAGSSAAAKLHSDPTLQRAERERTANLGALRASRKQRKQLEKSERGNDPIAKEEDDETGTLRRKTRFAKKIKKRNIAKDFNAMQLLNYWPAGARERFGDIVVRKPNTYASPAPAAGAASSVRAKGDDGLISTIAEVDIERDSDGLLIKTEEKDLETFSASGLVVPQQPKKPTAEAARGSPLKRVDAHVDLWDYLIDCVVTICHSRAPGSAATQKHRALQAMHRSRHIHADHFAIFSAPRTPIPGPSRVATPSRVFKGHSATPKTPRLRSGQASVVSAASARKQKSVVMEARDRLEAEMGRSFDEIYRRLLLVPVTSMSDLEGDRYANANSNQSVVHKSHAYLRSLFSKFDKNMNGFISKDEFRIAMAELHIEVTSEECDIFFHRFSSGCGELCWEEFLAFFDTQPMGISNKRPAGGGSGSGKGVSDVVEALIVMHRVLSRVMAEMLDQGISTIEAYLHRDADGANTVAVAPLGAAALSAAATAATAAASAANVPAQRPKFSRSVSSVKRAATKAMESPAEIIADTLPENAIFQKLTVQYAQTNSKNLQKLGLKIDSTIMGRISRVFGYDVAQLMRFLQLPLGSTADLKLSLEEAEVMITQSLHQRTGLKNADSTSSITKLWTGLSPNLQTNISYETLARYFTTLLDEAVEFANPSDATARAAVTPLSSSDEPMLARSASTAAGAGSVSKTIGAIETQVLCRIVADVLVYSNWNRAGHEVYSMPDAGPAAPAAAKPTSNTSSTASLQTIATGTAGNGSTGVSEGADSDGTLKLMNSLSYSGMDAYIRNSKIAFIERKLRYLMQLEINYSGSEVYMLVHVYLSRKKDELIILAHDPLSGDVYKLHRREDLSALPTGEALAEMFPLSHQWESTSREINALLMRPKRKIDPPVGHSATKKSAAAAIAGAGVGAAASDAVEMNITTYNSDALYLYNPWDTPGEDRAVSDMLKRLRLVRNSTSSASSKLIMAEDPKFVQSVKKLFEKSPTLPFFSIINELTLSFEVNDAPMLEQSQKSNHASIRSIVFGSIRKSKALYNFLVNVYSSLRVVLSTYNGGKRETFEWSEMLAHLTNNRNPFLTVQLLPAFIEPERYAYQPNEECVAFTGEEEIDVAPLRKGPVDFDGAPHPTWNSTFRFSFCPPQLTNCKVVCTEVVKMKIDDSFKYVAVMVREGKRTYGGDGGGRGGGADKDVRFPFWFLTIYDPRSATEYQCGVLPSSPLHAELYRKQPARTPNAACDLELGDYMELVSSAGEAMELILGPPITPRLEVNVYNEDGRTQELIGTCQVSISSVLSGTGITDPQWVLLSYKIDKDSGVGSKTLDTAAGEVQLDMRFHGQAEIDAELESNGRVADGTARSSGAASVGGTGKGAYGAPQRKRSVAATGGGGADTAEFIDCLDMLSSENDTLKLRYEKLEVKLKETAQQLEQVNNTGVNNTLQAELAAATAEAQKVLAEKQRVEEEKRTIQQQLDEAVAVARQAEEAQKALEQMELELQEAKAAAAQLEEEKQQLQAQVETAKPIARLSATAASLQDMMKQSFVQDGSAEQIIQEILLVLITRHSEEKSAAAHSTQNPLEGFFKLLHAHAKADGTITARDILISLSYLMIEIDVQSAMKIIRTAAPDGTSKEDHVLITTITELFTKVLAEINAAKRPSRPPSRGSRSRAGSPTDQQRRPSRPSSAQPSSQQRAPTDAARMLSSTGPQQEQLRSKSSNNLKRGKDSLNQTAPASTQAPRAAQDGDAESSSSSSPRAGAGPETAVDVDWSTVSLPPGWDRRFHAASNRYVYINHDTKKTQWHHPLDTSKAKSKKKK